jgi:hypothetical protein
MMFGLRSSLTHIPIKYKGPIVKPSHLRPIYLSVVGDRDRVPICTSYPYKFIQKHSLAITHRCAFPTTTCV